jgi:signal transduction histidine kinase
MSSIGVLATGIAHEINNPLTSVAGCAEALLRRFRDDLSLKDDLRLDVFPHYLEVIVRESYRCKGIIDHLLSFGRRSDGIAVKVDINMVLREILELLKYQPGYRQIRVVTALRQDLPRVLGDPSGLRQVCMNLLVNAHQAIDGGGVVEVGTEKAGEAMVSIVIRDTGCGMAALTYDIIKRHGGDIEVESRVGAGSSFTVLLPVGPE